ncbi:MAG: HAD family hydrolase [Chloroherpetonaceae bacterium]|nr:HAD family hydrolase [Chloroherpetonaceae bacterium]
MTKKLILFDIDGTLLRVRGISRESLIDALRETFGTEGSAATHDFAGKLDSVIIREVMRSAGLSETEIAEGFEEAKRRYIRNFKARVRREHIEVMTGVYALVEKLSREPNAVLALLTGNFEESGRHKLALPDLERYFAFGAFADDAPTRNELPPIAVERAFKRTGIRFAGKDVVIVGDTEHDVKCAKVLNSKCVAVATGHYSVERLRSFNPDCVLANFADVDAAFSAIMN